MLSEITLYILLWPACAVRLVAVGADSPFIFKVCAVGLSLAGAVLLIWLNVDYWSSFIGWRCWVRPGNRRCLLHVGGTSPHPAEPQMTIRWTSIVAAMLRCLLALAALAAAEGAWVL